jgi:rubredoxin
VYGILARRALILAVTMFRTTGMTAATSYKTWMCLVCGLIYDEAVGWPDDGIAPGTRWEDIPISWACPECGARKEDFEMVEL